MSLKPSGYSHPNIDGHTGPDRIYPIEYDGGVIFARRGGKFIDKHGGYYRLATANSSNLAGKAEVEAWPNTGATHPVSEITMTTTGQVGPVNFAIQNSFAIPTSGRQAVEGDKGHDHDIIVPGQVIGNPVQCVDMTASAQGILRISDILDSDGDYVACTIPPDKLYGNL